MRQYCSKECQIAAWPSHKVKCKLLGKWEYPSFTCRECGQLNEHEDEICESCGSEMFEGECVECGSLYEEIDEEIHESFTKNRKQIKEMFNRISRFN